jgi:hypothetical protein
MNNNNDHTVLIAVCVLLGIVLTISVAIIGSVYNNNQNISRDKYLVEHCQQVSKINTDNGFTTGEQYKCGVTK